MTSRPETTPGSGEAGLPRQPDARPGDTPAPATPPPVPGPGPGGNATPADPPDDAVDALPTVEEPGDARNETSDELSGEASGEAREGPAAPSDGASASGGGEAADTDDEAGTGVDTGTAPEASSQAASADGHATAPDGDGDPVAMVPAADPDPPAPQPTPELPTHGGDAVEPEHVVGAPPPGSTPRSATMAPDVVEPAAPASLLPGNPEEAPARAVARGRLGHAMRPRATRGQVLAGLLCALLGFALVVQARQTQTQGLEQLRQADLVRLLDTVTNAEARAEQAIRSEQATRDRLLSGSDSSEAAQQAAQQRLDTLGLLAGTVPATGPGIQLEISDPRRQVDASVLLDTLEELRDGGAEVVQIGDVRVVAATAFTDDADGVRVDGRLLTAPYRYTVIGEPQTLAKVLQIPGGVLDVLRSKGAQGKVTQPPTVRVDALRPPTQPQYARPAPGGTP